MTDECGIKRCRQKAHVYFNAPDLSVSYPVCSIHLTYMRTAKKSIAEMQWKDEYKNSEVSSI